MPRFEYKAKDGPEKVVRGSIVAGSRSEALSSLESRGLIPVWVRPACESAAEPHLWRRVPSRDITILTRQLAGLIRAGIPILRALSTLQEQTENRTLGAVLAEIESRIREGNTLSSALAMYTRLFPQIYVSMVKAGESAGRLDVVLERLAAAREADEEAHRRIRSAAAYPALILVVGFITVVVLLVFFLPRIAGLFRSISDLPLPTRILLAISASLSRSWMWLVLAGVLAFAILRRAAETAGGRRELDRLRMHVPLLGRLWVETDAARFARTFAMLLDSGVSLSSALDLSASTIESSAMREDVARIKREAVQDGSTISSGLKRSKVFPSLMASLAAVGEESGRLAEAMEEAASYYEKNVEHKVRTALSLLEPALVLVVGAIVGLIVAAMLLPIFRLSLVI